MKLTFYCLLLVISLLERTNSNFVCPIGSDEKPINGVFRHPTICSVYYHCYNGVAYGQQCPPGLHFKIVITECQYFACVQPSESKCSLKKNQLNKINILKNSSLKTILNGKAVGAKVGECHPNLNSTVPSSTEPSFYYNCLNGYGWVQQCPPLTKFNPIYDFEKCSNEMCRSSDGGSQPIDGGWNNWSDWSECSQLCGVGNRTRTRMCNNPPPSNGGKDCKGQSIQTELCSSNPCPVAGNPAFMVSLKETTTLNEGYFNWTVVNLNSGGMFDPNTNRITINKPGFYFFSMIITSSKLKPIDVRIRNSGLSLGILRKALPSYGPETFSRNGIFELANAAQPVLSTGITTDVYSSEEGKETSFLGFHYDTSNYLYCTSRTRINKPKIPWPIISAMKGFTEKSDLTEFRASNGGWYLVSMGMKAGFSGTGLVDSTKLILEISKNNVVQQTHKFLEINIRRQQVTDQFSRSSLIHVNTGDVFISRTGTRNKTPVSSSHYETYLSAFRLNTSLPRFMASGKLQTCDEFINIRFPEINVDSTDSWDITRNQYLVKKSGMYYIEFSFVPRPRETLDIRMYLNGKMIAITKKQARHDRGYVITRSILLSLEEGDILYWRNYGCLYNSYNFSSVIVISTSLSQ
ncbi:unnamed protein product [Dimorphilus gyrociliatus]|uniref:Chitin-binding type-2 domain-containing protein n=1 Tax=Dimorphilus gyrociliatus TaxID=2664684 RepID=A0A7I8WER2_9ANNE|nr:unnamed protein product [Dimorphilus gyrociliatus]